jgi:transketolase
MLKSCRDGFRDQIVETGEKNPHIFCLSADLVKTTGMGLFAEKFPDRFLDVGIDEANMLGVASGLSEHEHRVFCSSFGSFLTGRYDQIRMSIAYPNRPVVLVGTHSGMSIGMDGVPGMALEDVALMRALPNMQVWQPATYDEARAMTKELAEGELHGPVYFRLGRQGVEDWKPRPRGGSYGLRPWDPEVVILFSGCVADQVQKAADLLNSDPQFGFSGVATMPIQTAVRNVPILKPFNSNEVTCWTNNDIKLVVTVEDHSIVGGLGSAVAEVMAESYCRCRLLRIGIPDVFPGGGRLEDLYAKFGLTGEAIAKRIKEA